MQEEGMNTKALDWMIKNKTSVIAVAICFILVLVALLQGSADRPFLTAQSALELWQKTGDKKSQELFFAKASELRALKEKYHGYFIERDLEKGDLSSLEKRLTSSQKILEKELPLLALFSQTSLLMEKKAHKEALQKALSLKEALKDNSTSLLYALNEFRLATIYAELEDKENELRVLETLSYKIPLSESEMSFSDFLESRKQSLRG